MLTIITAPSPVLSQSAQRVGTVNKDIQILLEDMKKTLAATRDPEGVGLAAPQIGKSLQLFIMKPSSKSEIEVIINPSIVNNDQDKNSPPGSASDSASVRARKKKPPTKLEGCLSLPSIWGVVQRSPKVSISYTDETGTTKKKTFIGFPAIIVQHEFDHLQGILFPKRVLEQNGTLYRSSKNSKGEDEFEELEI